MKQTTISAICFVFVFGLSIPLIRKAASLQPVKAKAGVQADPADFPHLRAASPTPAPALANNVAQGKCDFGPDTCKLGFVWREAFSGDHVCVTGATRTQAANDNRLDSQRKVPGTDRCKLGFVWREASPSDRVCVPGATRSQTQADNRLAASRRDPACAPPSCQKQCATTRDECRKSNPSDTRKCVQEYKACVTNCQIESRRPRR